MLISCLNPDCPKRYQMVEVHGDSVFCAFCRSEYGSTIVKVRNWSERKGKIDEQRFSYFVKPLVAYTVSLIAFILVSMFAAIEGWQVSEYLTIAIIPAFIGWFVVLSLFSIRAKSKFPYPDHPQKVDIPVSNGS